jgi:hypothetical protein
MGRPFDALIEGATVVATTLFFARFNLAKVSAACGLPEGRRGDTVDRTCLV